MENINQQQYNKIRKMFFKNYPGGKIETIVTKTPDKKNKKYSITTKVYKTPTDYKYNNIASSCSYNGPDYNNVIKESTIDALGQLGIIYDENDISILEIFYNILLKQLQLLTVKIEYYNSFKSPKNLKSSNDPKNLDEINNNINEPRYTAEQWKAIMELEQSALNDMVIEEYKTNNDNEREIINGTL